MRHFKILIVILLLAACNNPITEDSQTTNYVEIADRITVKVAHEIESEAGLRLCGTGGGMMDHIRMMAMSFNCHRETTLEQGRELLIYCVNEYLTAINSNEQVRPYLVHYPFTPKDIEIRIFLSNSDQTEVSNGAISVLSEVGGKLVYCNRDTKDHLKDLHEETYEVAVELLEKSEPFEKIRRKVPSI